MRVSRRSEGSAAAAFMFGILTVLEGRWQYEPWFARGIYMAVDVTVFQTEAIALEEPLCCVLQNLQDGTLSEVDS